MILRKNWVYRWQGHEIRVEIRRDSRYWWDRLYLNGLLSAERRGWHFLPATLLGKVESVGGAHVEVRARVGWGRCRIWIDSALVVWADSWKWFQCKFEGHWVEMSYSERIYWRRLRLYIDGELVDERTGAGFPSKAGKSATGQTKRPDGSLAPVVALAGGIDGTSLLVGGELVFHR
jgi:hypothetical protein